MRLHFRLLLGLLLTCLPLSAQIDIPDLETTKASFHTEVVTVAPGDSFYVAIELDLPNRWHSYYLNSGGLELPLRIEWDLPEGFTHGPILWPPPEVKDGYFGKSYIYTGKPVFLVEITAPEDLKVGPKVELNARARWQICKETCKDEGMSWGSKLPTGEQPEPYPGLEEFFRKAIDALPRPLEGAHRLTSTGNTATLELPSSSKLGGTVVDFVPDQAFILSASSGGKVVQEDGRTLLQLPIATENGLGEPIEQGDSLSGIILLEDGSGVRLPLTEIEPSRTPAPKPEALGFLALLPILGGMFLGGLILNLMPCVFPVIGLKIMGFVQQAGEDRRKVMLHGVTFTLGVIASFAVLSGILFAARAAAGDAVGWGYQLQNPWVVLSLMLLMFLLGLNMFGLFEIGASATSIGGKLQSKQGISGSFFSGILATVVATPCSAPFLGAAIGAAIALPALQFFAAFGAMALGLSAPYLILSIFPKLIDFLPRPGAWMESFKQAMSFLLFATAGYLLWVYAGQIDLDNLLGPIFGMSFIAVAAWIHGRWNLPVRTKRTRLTALCLTIAFAASGLWLAKPPTPSALEWKTWTPELQAELLEQGTPVYIDFTAKWCATCQVNKKRAYTEAVVKQLNDKGVVALKADKTKPNEAIDKAIDGYDRAAIPVNVLLIPGKEPIILPELLSPDDVLEALGKIEGE